MPRADIHYESVYAPNRRAWREWLADNHATSPGVWLIYYKKKTGKPRVSYDEAVEEALCFGWIDSRPNKLDEERYQQLFSPRKPNSPWSKLNKDRVERLTRDGLMTAAGLTKVEQAQQNGAWTIYDAIEELSIPPDLGAALSADAVANANFAAFSASSKKNILWWIASAKRPETRAKRIAETVRLAAQNQRANH